MWTMIRGDAELRGTAMGDTFEVDIAAKDRRRGPPYPAPLRAGWATRPHDARRIPR